MIQFGVYWSDVTVDHVLEIDPKTYCIVQRHSFKITLLASTRFQKRSRLSKDRPLSLDLKP